MELFADVVMAPGGIIAWIVVGLLAGWIAGKLMSGRGYGVFSDIVLGLVGAMVGGFLSGFFMHGAVGFGQSTLIAAFGACVLIAIARALSPTRTRI